MGLVGRLLRFLGLSGGVPEASPRPVGAVERETSFGRDAPPTTPDQLPQFDLRQADNPRRTQLDHVDDAWQQTGRAERYRDPEDLGRGDRNDVVSQMQRFRRGREPLPYQISDDGEEIDENEDEV